MCRFSSTPIPKSLVLGRLNTGISVLQKRAGSRNTGIRDPSIAIPSHDALVKSELKNTGVYASISIIKYSVM